MDVRDYAIFGALASGVSALVGLLKFWTANSDRLTKVEGVALNALQEAAEAKNDHDNLREKVDELNRDHSDRIDRRSREIGDGLAAIRQKITDVELWNRDNFVKQTDFTNAVNDIKDSQSKMNEKLDEIRDRLPRRQGAPRAD